MAAEISHGNGDLDQDELPAKQPERSLAKFFSGNFFLVSLKLALVLSPLVATTIVLVYSIQYALPIVDSVGAVKDVIIYLALVAILLALVLIVFLLFPAYLSWTQKNT